EVAKRGASEMLKNADGILIPGGFGGRGIEGKIATIKMARENKVPFFGICLGMQCAVIEFARNVCGLAEANSAEFDPSTPHPVIDILPEQNNIINKGGTMRLGAYRCQLRKDSLAFRSYGKKEISERHRHRYEFNNKYRMQLEEAGLKISGLSPEGNLVEIIEIEEHPWFLAGQFHPEFQSSPKNPHPLFREFIKASLNRKLKHG
ncbi:MAG: gamma-glutamyl-gamma-aminobutyrate hydrolase family protein, partial [Nitrospinota bacterium]